MTIEKLRRVMWRLDENRTGSHIKKSDLERAIMQECGTDPSTVRNNIKNLVKLKWLEKRKTRYRVLKGYQTSDINDEIEAPTPNVEKDTLWKLCSNMESEAGDIYDSGK